MPTTESGGVQLYYEVSGNPSGPFLLFANSLGSDLHMWDLLLPAFESRYRVLRFDMRGHGKSGVAREPFSIEDLGHDVLQLMDDVGTGRASLCGVSLGGLVALWLGVHAQDRVDRLILANTAARIGSRAMWEQRIEMVRNVGMPSLAAETISRWFTPAYRAGHPEEMERIRQMIAATNLDGYAACCGVLRDTDLHTEAVAVKAASLVIAGTRDPATPSADGRALHWIIPKSRYVELEASHLSAWERAKEFAGAALQHLDGVEAANG